MVCVCGGVNLRWCRIEGEATGTGAPQGWLEVASGKSAPRGAVASLALALMSTALRPAGEELLEVLLIGGQAVFEAVHGSLVTLAGLQPAEAAATGTRAASTLQKAPRTFTLLPLILPPRSPSPFLLSLLHL